VQWNGDTTDFVVFFEEKISFCVMEAGFLRHILYVKATLF